MMFDKETLLSNAQAPTTGTTVSTNSYDLGAAGTVPGLGGTVPYDVGKGKMVEVDVQVTTTCTSGGSNTTKAQLITSASADLSTPTVIASSEAIAVATLIAGYRFRLRGITQGVTQRYLGVQYVIATADLTAGAFTAGVILDVQSNL